MAVNLSSVGLSGISAAEVAIAAIESNITNASNPNYSVEQVNLSARSGPLGQGTGVDVLPTTRIEAPFLNGQIIGTLATQNYNQALAQVTTLAQQIIAPSSGADLATALQNLINSFTNLSASPQDPTLRTTVINAANNFAQLTQSISGNLQATTNSELLQLPALVTQINAISQQIGKLNAQILAFTAEGQSAAASKDQRDGLINQLAGLVGASTDGNGNVNVGGVPLVAGTTAITLGITGAGVGTGLQIVLPNGTIPIPPAQIGGTVGGMLAGAVSITNLIASVNNFATSTAVAYNVQHASGFGLNGATGNALFLIPGGPGPIAINPAITVQNLAASSTLAGVPGDGSNATAMAAIGNIAGLDAAYPQATLGQAISQVESGFGATVQNANNNQAQATSALQSLNTLKGSITGVSLNDQLAHLVEYQNLLQASGRAVSAATNLLTYLIQELQ
jgi:flagellar hook-associated protein 1 FlgK